MENSAPKNIFILVALLFGGYFAYKIVAALLGAIIGVAVPLVIVGGIGYFIYLNSSRKSLGGGRRTLP